ncbi:MAG: pyridoxal-5'-phosphate-dependent protein [Anaerolineae bacterium UTCFX2]|jgi:D-cysteine desulfhydrase family pyridoxal phosphate-dependent enzyme|nr:D-cysteine desulfhydrase family protein [Anaerolineales bacterium]OQY89715.1 MAG: pyridoxal-5'-phosphate-dependent protein [Anaerolineae bacterium UTCFX2]
MKNLPHLKIAHLPTPVESLPRLTASLGGPKIWVKRDDQTGLALGGNKTRKLEFLVAEAQANGAKTLITAGALQSNHCRQTAAAAARYGFDCILVLYPVDASGGSEDRLPSLSANLLVDRLLGAEIVLTRRAEREATLDQTFQAAWAAGRRPYLIPYGGSNPSGAAAYAVAMQEFLAQQLPVDWIVFPSSSGGTQAGLVVGAQAFGFQGRVLGISVDETTETLKARVASLATQTADLLGERFTFAAEDILVNADYVGGGYGVPGPGERRAIDLFARKEGLLLDPVYTARAAFGLIDLIRKGFFAPEERVLFWHTGGAPALFADKYRDWLSQPQAD